MDKILILGASSLIGKALTDKGIQLGHLCTCVYHRLPDKSKNGIVWDILDNNLRWIDNLEDEYKSLIVLSWVGNKKDERDNKELNMKCAYNIYLCIKKICDSRKIHQVILCGSQAEYGNISGKVNEDYRIDERKVSAYGIAKKYLFDKLNKEQVCEKILELRFHSVYGYAKYKNQMLVNVIEKALNGEDIFFSTDCRQHFNYLYVDDAVDIIYEMIDGNFKGIFNVAADKTARLYEYIEDILRILKSDSSVEYGNISEKSDIILDTSKLKNSLMWKQKISFEAGVKNIANKIREAM